jgi:hypothetical protein
MRSPFDWVVSEKDFPIEDDRFCRFCGRRLEYRDSLYCMCLPDDYDYTRHPDSCGADADEPEEELTELEGDTLHVVEVIDVDESECPTDDGLEVSK